MKDVAMKEKMMYYGVILAQRFTHKQKQFFYEQINERFNDLGFQVALQSESFRYNSVNNIIIGDIDKASKLIVAAYDTPTYIHFFDAKYYPFNSKKNSEQDLLYLLIQLLVTTLLGGLLYFVISDIASFSLVIKIVSIAFSIAVVLAIIWLFLTKSNPINFNRNSAALAVIEAVGEMCDTEEVAFVLLDYGVNSYQGHKVFCQSYSVTKPVLLLDAIAYGETVVIAHRDNIDVEVYLKDDKLKIVDKIYDERQAESNTLAFFKKASILTTGSIEKGQFIVRNVRSKKDHQVDMERLSLITNLIVNDIKGERKCSYDNT